METSLGISSVVAFGSDSVALGVSDAAGYSWINDSSIATFASDDFYIGNFGLGQQPTNFANLTSPQPSFLTALKAQNAIPSLSWGYTAGAHYRE